MKTKTNQPFAGRLLLVSTFSFCGASVNRDSTRAVPFFYWASGIHLTSLCGKVIINFWRCCDIKRRGKDLVKLRGREKTATRSLNALVFKSCLHGLETVSVFKKSIKNPVHIINLFRIRNNGAMFPAVYDKMLPDKANRRVPADPVPLFY